VLSDWRQASPYPGNAPPQEEGPSPAEYSDNYRMEATDLKVGGQRRKTSGPRITFIEASETQHILYNWRLVPACVPCICGKIAIRSFPSNTNLLSALNLLYISATFRLCISCLSLLCHSARRTIRIKTVVVFAAAFSTFEWRLGYLVSECKGPRSSRRSSQRGA
jgi:hypothetical protein